MSEVTQEDREARKRFQQRFLTEGISESELLDEEFARHRTTALAAKEAENAELRAEVERLREALQHIGRYDPTSWQATTARAALAEAQPERNPDNG